MNDHISKPIEVEKMYATLSKWITPKKPAEEAAPAAVPLDGADGAKRSGGLANARVPGLNLEKALHRLGGNERILTMSMRQFCDMHAGDLRLMREALDENRHSDANRYAHTLKGLAATLGADELSGHFAALETALANSATRYEDIRDTFEKSSAELAKLIANIKELLDNLDHEDGSDGPKEAHPAFSGETAAVLSKLRELMEDDDASAHTVLADNLSLLKDSLPPPQFRLLENQINNFDFEEALNTLQKIMPGNQR